MEWLPTPLFLPGEFFGQRSLAYYCPWDLKESNITEQLTLLLWVFACSLDGKESACSTRDLGSIPGLEVPLERGMSTHSITLAWRIPWTEESGGLQSMGWQIIRHD